MKSPISNKKLNPSAVPLPKTNLPDQKQQVDPHERFLSMMNHTSLISTYIGKPPPFTNEIDRENCDKQPTTKPRLAQSVARACPEHPTEFDPLDSARAVLRLPTQKNG
jgi:hypothetical protein